MATGNEELLKFLSDLGASTELIDRAVSTGTLRGLAADLLLTQGSDMTVADIAREAGVDSETVTRIWRDLGINAGLDDHRFGARDVQLVRSLLAASNLEVTGAELMRVVGASLSRIADAAVTLYVQDVEDRKGDGALSHLELARDLARSVEFALQLGDLVIGPALAQHLRDAIWRQRITQRGVTERIVARMAVGFVDLVGFTQLANRVAPRELLERISAFEARAFDVANDCGGRIVKHVGDEVMFTAVSGDLACRVALTMMEEFEASGIQPRGGVAFGEVITYHGDYYGPVVNLASRLTDQAVPGEILVDGALQRSTDRTAGAAFEPAGRRQLKGFDQPVTVFSLVRG